MKRLSAHEFASRIRTSSCWAIAPDPGFAGELLLTTQATPDSEPEQFLGPDPLTMTFEECKLFVSGVMGAISYSARHLTVLVNEDGSLTLGMRPEEMKKWLESIHESCRGYFRVRLHWPMHKEVSVEEYLKMEGDHDGQGN